VHTRGERDGCGGLGISAPCGIARARALLLDFGFGLGASREADSCAQADKRGKKGLGIQAGWVGQGPVNTGGEGVGMAAWEPAC